MSKDLGLKIGTPEQSQWDLVLKQTEELILKGKIDLEINEGIRDLAAKNVKIEEDKQIS